MSGTNRVEILQLNVFSGGVSTGHWMLPRLLISIDFVNSSGVTKLLTAVYFRWILKRYSIVLQRLVFLILQQCSRCKDNKKIWHISQTKYWLFIDFVVKILMCSECYSVVFLCQWNWDICISWLNLRNIKKAMDFFKIYFM